MRTTAPSWLPGPATEAGLRDGDAGRMATQGCAGGTKKLLDGKLQ